MWHIGVNTKYIQAPLRSISRRGKPLSAVATKGSVTAFTANTGLKVATKKVSQRLPSQWRRTKENSSSPLRILLYENFYEKV